MGQKAEYRSGSAVFKTGSIVLLATTDKILVPCTSTERLIACPKVISSYWLSELRNQALLGTALGVVVSNQ